VSGYVTPIDSIGYKAVNMVYTETLSSCNSGSIPRKYSPWLWLYSKRTKKAKQLFKAFGLWQRCDSLPMSISESHTLNLLVSIAAFVELLTKQNSQRWHNWRFSQLQSFRFYIIIKSVQQWAGFFLLSQHSIHNSYKFHNQRSTINQLFMFGWPTVVSLFFKENKKRGCRFHP